MAQLDSRKRTELRDTDFAYVADNQLVISVPEGGIFIATHIVHPVVVVRRGERRTLSLTLGDKPDWATRGEAAGRP